MKKTIKPAKIQETRLADYLPPAFLVDEVELDFDIRDKETRVTSRLQMRRNPAAKNAKAPLVLNGEHQKLLRVVLNGVELTKQSYELTEKHLTISFVPETFILEVESTNVPSKNTALSGLYAAGPMLCTQCESEGFRRITYFPDRPDVLATYRVTIHADQKKYPILLANGNLIKKGKEKGARHFAIWEDPFRKPCYLFALVAGQMDKASSHFVTKSGRKILLEIYVEPGRKSETGFAMEALKKSMKWDEDAYGLEYDLDRFMIVAVSYFNFGAMENKGLNIFNDACVLGRSDTAIDADIAFFERVVGHEYFHNYTGDRVTCRDWFQLSLKEGLTVFREQEFCGDMNDRALERIQSVSKLRSFQFPEDAGAMAHPIRPSAYESVENFYTSTVYGKGAEVVRMIQTLVGRKGFRKGLRLYLKRHDGQAATCEDFVSAMAEANAIDLDHFLLWYSQAGTPVLDVTSQYDAKKKEYTLKVKQHTAPTAGQKTKKPLYMPFSVGLLDSKGKDTKGTFVIDLSLAEDQITFLNVESKPVPSLLRDFSAPVRLNYPYTDEELLLLMGHDTDDFNRWDAAQKIYAKYVLEGGEIPANLIEALRNILKNKRIADGTKAAMLALPSETDLGLMLKAQGKKIDPIKLYHQRQRVIRAIATGLASELWEAYATIETTLSEKASDGKARGSRSLKHLCLAYLDKVVPEDTVALAAGAVSTSTNMTDKVAGLSLLADSDAPIKDKMLTLFAKTYLTQPSIMDEWLTAQASARRADVLKTVRKLMTHKAFNIKNPNRVSALIGAFIGNPLGFHAADGSGYAFVADVALKLDRLNPMTTSRLVKPFLRWRDFDPKRQKLMKATLKRIAAQKELSPNVREVVGKALKGT